MEKIKIRPAGKEDAMMIARVVCMAIGGDETHRLFPIFVELASMEGAQYSYRHAMVAEVDGKFAGAVVGYDGARLQELRVPLYVLSQHYLGERIEVEEETGAGEFYIDSLAVFPEYQRHGIGRQLLEKAIGKAFEEGHATVGLLVDVENPRAEQLYRSLGFERVNPTTFLGHPMWHLQRIQK